MKILALDSSGLPASVAIVEDDNLIAEYTVNYKKTHSQTLLPMLDEVVKMTGTNLAEIDAIAVAKGPGSFTGLRIGSATVKGLGLALDKPVIGIPTVEGLAMNLWGAQALVCPLMDARRNQVYTGIYRFRSGELQVVREQAALALEEVVHALNLIGEEVIFLGDGVQVYRHLLEEKLEVPYTIAPAHMNKQRAASVAARALEYWNQGLYENADSFEPEYLRLSQAERERRQKYSEAREKIEIVPLQYEYCDAVAEIAAQTLPEHWSVESIRDVLRHKNNIYLVAREIESRRIVGFAGIMVIDGEAELLNIALRAEFRGCGTGGRLLTLVMEEAAKQGANRILLEVRESNIAARQFYERYHFEELSRRKRYYSNPVEDAVIMEINNYYHWNLHIN